MSTNQNTGTLVSRITGVKIYHIDGDHVFVAYGEHNYFALNARLVPQPSIPGALEYTLEVDERSMPVITPVQARGTFTGNPKTITVRGAENCVTEPVHPLESDGGDQPTPFDMAFSLDRFEFQQSIQEVIPGTTLTAAFQLEGQLVLGSGGCNTYVARWVYRPGIGGPSLRIYDLRATKKLCGQPEGIMEQEERYFRELQLVETYEFTQDGMLRLSWAEGRAALLFKPLC